MEKQFKAKREMYTHQMIWRTAESLLDQANQTEEGAYYFRLPGLLMYYLAYEAFINFLGQAVCPDLWAKEKENFKGVGLEGKIEKLCGMVPGFQWEKGRKPYQAIKELEKFRDKVVHAKFEISDYSAPFDKEGKSHIKWETEWDKFIPDNQKIEQYKTAIQEFCESLRQAINATFPNPIHPQLNHPAFEGSFGNITGTLED